MKQKTTYIKTILILLNNRLIKEKIKNTIKVFLLLKWSFL